MLIKELLQLPVQRTHLINRIHGMIGGTDFSEPGCTHELEETHTGLTVRLTLKLRILFRQNLYSAHSNIHSDILIIIVLLTVPFGPANTRIIGFLFCILSFPICILNISQLFFFVITCYRFFTNLCFIYCCFNSLNCSFVHFIIWYGQRTFFFFLGYNFYNSSTFCAYSCRINTPSVLIDMQNTYKLHLIINYDNIFYHSSHKKTPQNRNSGVLNNSAWYSVR